MKNLRIKTKLLMQTTFLLLGLTALGVVSLVFMYRMNERNTAINDDWLPSVVTAEDLDTLTSNFRIREYGHIIAWEPDIMALREEQMADLLLEIDAKFAEYDQLGSSDEEKQMLASARLAWADYLQLHNTVVELSRSGEMEQAMVIARADSQKLFDEATEIFEELVEYSKTNAQTASHESTLLYSRAWMLLISIIVLLIAAGFLLSLATVKAILTPVNELDNAAARIADGNLNEVITYDSKDELGSLAVNFNKTVTRLKDYVNYIKEISAVLNQIADGDLAFELTYDYAGEFRKIKEALEHISGSLNGIIGQINRASDQVASGAEQVATGAQSLSQGTSEQAGSIEGLAAFVGDISGQIRGNASNAEQASEKARRVGDQMYASNLQMQRMIAAMDEISSSSREIGNIIETIESIALQTNILALNASVEAARAGVAGKGFTVIANEVRNLAGDTADASKNTSALIESSMKAVKNGAAIASETAAAMMEAVNGAVEAAETVDLISKASLKQAEATSQITMGIDQITAVIQSNSATAEECAAASEELSDQANLLNGLVEQFRLKKR